MDNMDLNEQKIKELEEKVDAVYRSVEKIRKYLLWTAIITVVLFVLPLLGLMFAIPSFISNYSNLELISK